MSDIFVIEMDTKPTNAMQVTAFAQAMVDLKGAKTEEDLVSVVARAKPLPEGPAKVKLRELLSQAISRVRAPKPMVVDRFDETTLDQTAEDITVEMPAVAPAGPQVAAPDLSNLAISWSCAFHSLATGLAFRKPGPDGKAAQSRYTTRYTQTPASVAQRQAVAAQSVAREVNVIVGAKSAGSGVLLGWSGYGEITLPHIRNCLKTVGLPSDWAPRPRSPHAHAAAALTKLTTNGNIVRATRTGRRDRTTRTYLAHWTVGAPTHGDVGDAMGTVALTAELYNGGILKLDGDQGLAAVVEGEYNRLVESEAWPAGDVTTWLRTTMIEQFRAVKLGVGWYVPAEFAEPAEKLCQCLSNHWGQGWVLPALPVSTTEQLRAGLAKGLVSEADGVLAEFEAQRQAALKDRGTDVGPKLAATMLSKLKTVYSRAKDYLDMLGPEHIAPVREKLAGAIELIEAKCDDTAQRFAMMDLV